MKQNQENNSLGTTLTGGVGGIIGGIGVAALMMCKLTLDMGMPEHDISWRGFGSRGNAIYAAYRLSHGVHRRMGKPNPVNV